LVRLWDGYEDVTMSRYLTTILIVLALALSVCSAVLSMRNLRRLRELDSQFGPYSPIRDDAPLEEFEMFINTLKRYNTTGDDGSISILRGIAQRNPKVYYYQHYLAEALFEEGEWEESAAVCEQLVFYHYWEVTNGRLESILNRTLFERTLEYGQKALGRLGRAYESKRLITMGKYVLGQD